MISFLLLLGILAVFLFGLSSSISSFESLLAYILSNIYIILGSILFVTTCFVVAYYVYKNKIDEYTFRRYLIVSILMMVMIIFVIPYVAGKFYNTYRVKLILTLYNPLFKDVEISSFIVDYNSFQKYYNPIPSTTKLSLFGDTVMITVDTFCYQNNIKSYYYRWVGYVDVPELSSKTIDIWVYNIPSNSFCKSVAIVKSGNSYDSKVITFQVP